MAFTQSNLYFYQLWQLANRFLVLGLYCYGQMGVLLPHNTRHLRWTIANSHVTYSTVHCNGWHLLIVLAVYEIPAGHWHPVEGRRKWVQIAAGILGWPLGKCVWWNPLFLKQNHNLSNPCCWKPPDKVSCWRQNISFTIVTYQKSP